MSRSKLSRKDTTYLNNAKRAWNSPNKKFKGCSMDEWIDQISGVFDETKETKRMSRLKTPEDASFGYVAPNIDSPRTPSFDRWYNTANQLNFARWKQLVDMVVEEDSNGCR